MTSFSMKELINEWLKNPNYLIGVEIYRRFGSNSFLKNVFATGYSQYNFLRLKDELKQLQQVDIVHPTAQITTPKTVQVKKENSPSDSVNAPFEIKQAIEERKTLYAEARVLKFKLPSIEDQEQRFQNCLKIKQNFIRISAIWELTNFYDRHERLPEIIQKVESSLDDESSVILNKKWINHYKYIKNFVDNPAKATKVKERYNEAKQIELILIERDLFQYTNLKIPVPNG
jgi:hypothetical protein